MAEWSYLAVNQSQSLFAVVYRLLPGPTPTPVLSILVGYSLDDRLGEWLRCGERGAGGGPMVSAARREDKDVVRRGL